MQEHVNLEVKALDPDPGETERACLELGAVPQGMLRQRDTYFAVPAGRLKLREELETGTAELIFYERPGEDGVRASRYRRAGVSAPRETAALLGACLGVVGVVEKRRTLLRYENVRIHLDDVDGLGTFLELEAVLASQDGVPTAAERSALQHVTEALWLEERPKIAGSYLDVQGASPPPGR